MERLVKAIDSGRSRDLDAALQSVLRDARHDAAPVCAAALNRLTHPATHEIALARV